MTCGECDRTALQQAHNTSNKAICRTYTTYKGKKRPFQTIRIVNNTPQGSETEMLGDKMTKSDAKFGISLSRAFCLEGETSLQRHSWVLYCRWGWGFLADHFIIQPLCTWRNVRVKGPDCCAVASTIEEPTLWPQGEIWSPQSILNDKSRLISAAPRIRNTPQRT